MNHYIQPTVPEAAVLAVRLGAGNTLADRFTAADVGKIVKLGGESAYVMAVRGNDIEGQVTSVEAQQNGFSIGGVQEQGRMRVKFDGLQATVGVGAVAVGDYVVAAAQPALGVKLVDFPAVCKATDASTSNIKWRVVSLGTVGTGAVGTVGVIARI